MKTTSNQTRIFKFPVVKMSVIDQDTPGAPAPSRSTVRQDFLPLSQDVQNEVLAQAKALASTDTAFATFRLAPDVTYNIENSNKLIETNSTFTPKGFSTASANDNSNSTLISPDITGSFHFRVHALFTATIKSGGPSSFNQDNFSIKIRDENNDSDVLVMTFDGSVFYDQASGGTGNGQLFYEGVVQLDSGVQYSIKAVNVGPLQQITINSGSYTVQRIQQQSDIPNNLSL